MNKKVVLALVIGGVVILLLVGLLLLKTVFSKAKSEVKEVAQKVAERVVKKQSLRDLLLAGGTVSCTFESGKTYVSGKKVRADFDKSHMIQDGVYAYAWSDGETTGTKMKIDDVASTTKDVPKQDVPSQGPTFDDDEQYDMNCTPWIADESMFVPPTNVQFTDLSQMIKNLPKAPTGTCDQITDPTAKAMCESSLGQ